jgi:hypothetical protein
MKKSHGYDDDICEYEYSSIYYVKPCEEGKFCKDYGDLSKCEEIETPFQGKILGDSCSDDLECEANLICQGQCTLSCGITNNYEPYKTYSGYYSCREKNDRFTLYKMDFPGVVNYADLISYLNTSPSKSLLQSPSFFQVPGEIQFFSRKDQTATDYGTLYRIQTIQSAYIGTLDDGTFVMDKKACKSGFALYFYPDGSDRVDPSSKRYYKNKMYLKCVTLKDVNKEKKYVKYELKEKEYYYDYDVDRPTEKFDENGLTPDSLNIPIPTYPLIENELFSKYIGAFTKSKQEECENNKKYLEQNTCEDSEVRKWYYFYNHPEEYVLYYDEEEKDNDIMNFLLQKKYRTFISGNFLFMKFLLPITMLLFL